MQYAFSVMLAERAPLQALNTLRLAATAAALRAPDSIAALRAALTEARAAGLPVVVLGEGSNIVLTGDLPAMVLRYRATGCEVVRDDGERVTLRVAAGENWHALTGWTLERGLYGLENLALIPGTVGAAPIQNIGAYGVELAQFVASVQALDIASGQLFTLGATDCEFGYRDSVFKGRLRDRCVITSVDLTLSRTDAPEIRYAALAERLADGPSRPAAKDVYRAVMALRQARLPDPAKTPNVGSFFKNPVISSARAHELRNDHPEMPLFELADGQVKIPAGWLIEACGWKGYSCNGVGVHADHALVLINTGGGSGAAILDLATRIQRSVRQRFDCELEIEPRVYGRVV